MTRIQMTRRGQFIITIPKNIVELLNLRKGDDLIMGLTAQKEIILSKGGNTKNGRKK